MSASARRLTGCRWPGWGRTPFRPVCFFLLLALLAAGTAACGGGEEERDDGASPPALTPDPASPSPGATKTREAPERSAVPAGPAARPVLGVAGVIPPHHPNPDAADWQAYLDSLAETGELVGVYTNWYDAPEFAGQVPLVFEGLSGQLAARGLQIVAALGTQRVGAGGVVEPTVEFGDPTSEGAFVETARKLALRLRPPYLALGVEVDLLADQDPDAFERFVTLYERAYDEVKRVSPETLVFTVFQYEHFRGGGFLLDGVRQRPPSWDLVERFGSRLDLLAFTTYPFFDYETPGELPDDYYAAAAERYGLPLAFTEIGWPASRLSNAPDSAFGGSEAEQAEFVDRFAGLIAGLDVAIALWSLPYDPAGVPPAFESIALRTNEGVARAALERWRKLGPDE